MLIKVSDTVMINHRSISAIEIANTDDARRVFIHADGKTFNLGVPYDEFMKKLHDIQKEEDAQKVYWAGK